MLLASERWWSLSSGYTVEVRVSKLDLGQVSLADRILLGLGVAVARLGSIVLERVVYCRGYEGDYVGFVERGVDLGLMMKTAVLEHSW
jgi:hypothetical protein